MSWKKMLFGEKMPDKNDPQYRERYEREVNAGQRFAKATRIDRLAVHVQNFANHHSKAFLVIVFGFVIFCFALNLYRIAHAYNNQNVAPTATERQEQMLEKRHEKLNIHRQEKVEKTNRSLELLEYKSFNQR